MPEHWYDDVVTPALLRGARRAYAGSMKAAYDEGGFEDMPRNGTWIVGGIALNGPMDGLSDVARDLGLSKQSVSQLVDALVLRGYVERVAAEGDRRRVVVDLTDRGRAAAATSKGAREAVDAKLTEAVGAAGVAKMRAALAALNEMR